MGVELVLLLLLLLLLGRSNRVFRPGGRRQSITPPMLDLPTCSARTHNSTATTTASRSCKNIIKSFWASSWTLPLFSDSAPAPATITRPLNLINNAERYPWLWWAHNLGHDICNGGRNLLRERLPSGHPFLHACCATSWKRIYDFKRFFYIGFLYRMELLVCLNHCHYRVNIWILFLWFYNLIDITLKETFFSNIFR